MTPTPATSRETAALTGLGIVAVGESAVRAAAGPARSAWDSRLLRPARWVATPVVGRLARRGEEEQVRLKALARGGVTELAVGVVVDHAVVERAVGQLLSAGVLEDVADQIAASRLPQHVVEDALAERVADSLVASVLASPGLSRVIDQVLASPELERVVAHIARSPEVRAALTAQSAGLVDEFAGEVRARTAVADDAAERVARRLLHRRRIATEPG